MEKQDKGGAGPSPLLDVVAAQQRLLAVFAPLQAESVPISQAAGRVLSAPARSPLDLPPFSNSSMDGFAVRVSDVALAAERPARLAVAADIPAGQVVEIHLQPGQAARIMTGAPLPQGAEAVVPVEDTDFDDRQPGTPAPSEVIIYRSAAPGENVRQQGEDLRAGQVVLQAGSRLRPQEIGFLAMLGQAAVSVHRLPKIAVFSTGDELLPVDTPLTPGKIHDSNSYTLISLIKKYGGETLNLGIVPDQAEAVQSRLERARAEKVDLILSSAGVSVGAFDFVRSVVEQHGHLEFWRVNMRPGKPLAFGNYRGIPFIGLPGNPVSAFVGFEVFVRPAILKMCGLEGLERQVQRAVLQEPVESDGRESYLRGVVRREGGRWLARLTGHQGSGNLHSLVQSNALLIIPSGVKSLPSGAEVDAWLLEAD